MSFKRRHWWWAVLITLVVVGIARLKFDIEVLNLLPSDLPVVEGLKLYQRHFSNADELIITLSAGDDEQAANSARDLALALREQTNLVARALWQSPGQEHPEQMPELLALMWLNQPPERFNELASRLSPGNLTNVLADTRRSLATTLSPEDIARLGYDPFGLTRVPAAPANPASAFGQGEEFFASRSGIFRLVFVQPAVPLPSYRECGRWLEQVQSVVEKFRRSSSLTGDVEIGFTGAPAFIAETSSGMEQDLTRSALGTLVVVAVLFWAAHRRWIPLLWLVVLLVSIVGGTLALGGLVFGTLNVVSLGFAAILLGLTVDYALVLYQEARHRKDAPIAEVRRSMTPSIAWSALTTACAFALLNFAALPGLAQLGTLVALGIVLGALMMLAWFLPVAAKRGPVVDTGGTRCAPPPETAGSSQSLNGESPATHPNGQSRFESAAAMLATVGLAIIAAAILWHRFPAVDHTAEALSPVGSPAYRAMAQIKEHLAQTNEPLWLLISGRDEAEVANRMEAMESRLRSVELRPWVAGATMPSALWPRPERQQVNRAAAARLAAQREVFRSSLRRSGFTDDAFALAGGILNTWERAAESTTPLWPTNEANRWILEKVSARTGAGWLALGIVQSATNSALAYAGANLILGAESPGNGAVLTGWPALGEALLQHTEQRLPWVMAAMLLFVALCLWLAFRTFREVLLSFAVLTASFAGLLTVMAMAGWSWNLLNLMAVPLLLGAGVDYTIHTQLALRRCGGDVAAVRRTTGRALLLCAGTTMVGFGSLIWTGNAGLSSLGRVCAAGVACVLFISWCLLPSWWHWLMAGKCAPSQPSSLYRTDVWQLGLFVGRLLPARVCGWFSRGLALLYYHTQPQRREVVIKNLLPVLNGERANAERTARTLFQQFAQKVADLWRYESGAAVEQWLTEWNGWEIFSAAHARGKGVLLVTPHLGNWEFGGALLAGRGFKLLVLTQPEPEQRMTEMRQSSRARRGIETLVVGEDAFAFIEIIKRLQDGATVALLVDRPPPATEVTIELFGQPFRASIAAAELARASGCAILPTYVVRNDNGYRAQILPEIHYDRAAIGNRVSRIQLTQEILRAFEPAIRQHAEQWFHFVPVWP